MTEPTPTDRVRVAWELCETSRSLCECKVAQSRGACEAEMEYAKTAIALGAKPPVDPVDELIAEMRIWLNRHDIFRNRNGEWLPGGCMAGDIVRQVLARAQEMGL